MAPPGETSPSKLLQAEAIEDLANMPPQPTDAEWTKAKEVPLINGAPLGCTARLSGPWLRVACAHRALLLITMVPLQGHHKTQTKVQLAAGQGHIVLPFVEGTNFVARVEFSAERRFLVVRWPNGQKAPETFAVLEPSRD